MVNFNINSKLRERTDWLIKPINRELLLMSSTKELSNLSHVQQEEMPASIAFSLGRIAVWKAQVGIKAIGEGDEQGWASVHAASFCRAWQCRINMHRVELDKRPRKRLAGAQPREVALSLLDALWAQHGRQSDALGSRYCSWLVDEAYYGGSMYIQNGFAGFTCQLYRTWKNRSPVEPLSGSPPLGIYEAIFDNWTDESGLERAVVAMCDFHVERMTEHHDRDIAEFSTTPYDVIPVEYLALKRVRKELGLETPKPKHPLLNTPFSEPPEPLPEVKDELLDRAIKAVREVMPDL